MEVARLALATRPQRPRALWSKLHHDLIPLMRADDRVSAACIVREYVCLAVAIGVGAVAFAGFREGRMGLAAFAAVAMLFVAVIAALQHRLSGLAHEASHYVLFRNLVANELVSDLLLMFPLVAMTQKYRVAHLGHHQHVNDAERDPDWLRLAHFEPMRFPLNRGRFFARYVLRGIWPPAILRYLFGRAKAANVATVAPGAKALRTVYSTRVARTMRGAYWLSMFTVIHACGAWPIFWLFWVLPLLTFYPFYMLLREIAHHANAPDDGNFTNSRLFDVHPMLRWAVFPYGQDFHVLHHLFAMIPHHQMRRAHAMLLRYPAYQRDIVVCRGYFWRKRGTVGPCVLDVLAEGAGRGGKT